MKVYHRFLPEIRNRYIPFNIINISTSLLLISLSKPTVIKLSENFRHFLEKITKKKKERKEKKEPLTMGRSSSPPGLDGDGNENGKNNAINNNNDTTTTNNDQGFYSIRDRFPFKRNPGHSRDRTKQYSLLERPLVRNRARFNRKGLLHLPFRGIYLFYFLIFFSVFAFAVASMVMQSSITAMLFRQGGERSWRRSIREGLRFGSSLKFMPAGISRLLAEGGGLDPMRSTDRIGFRGPRLALVSHTFFIFLLTIGLIN